MMNTKIVYVLVSQDSDYYYEMTLLSLYSLRLFHPNETVVIVMDEDTHRRLLDKRAAILNDVTPIIIAIPEEYNSTQRSRYLKTRLRQIVDGDFFYLDCDTLICSSLAAIDSMESDIAMVEDFAFCKDNIETCKKAGFHHLEGQIYYNGGVMYAKSTPPSYAFFEEWHRYWLQSLKNGVPQDQPALWQTNMTLQNQIKRLPVVWNCQIQNRSVVKDVDHAIVLHYFAYKMTHHGKVLLRYVRRENGLGRLSTYIAKHPRTIGYLVFARLNETSVQHVSERSFRDALPLSLKPLVRFYQFLWWAKRQGAKVRSIL